MHNRLLETLMRLFVLFQLSFVLCLNLGRSQTIDTLWHETWEGNPTANWDVQGGQWQWGIPTSGPGSAYAGANVAATVLAGNYSEPADARLRRIVSFRVPPATQNPRLRFWHWYSFNAGDYGRVEIRRVGQAWTPISTDYDWTGSGVWTYPLIDLTAYADSMIEISFLFHSVDVVGNGGPDVGPGWYLDNVAVLMGPVLLNNPEGFESGIGNWAAERGTWEVGRPDSTNGPRRAYAGQNCAATVLRGNYAEPVDSRLISPRFTVPPAANNPRLRFWHWYSFSTGDDATLEIRVGNGAWTRISNLYNATGSGVWTSAYVDLSPFANAAVQIALRFYSVDVVGNGGPDVSTGWYVDEVRLVTGSILLPNVEFFESGINDWSGERGTWEVGIPTSGPRRAYQGQNCAATVLTGDYAEPVDSRLLSPPFSALLRTNSLRFWHWFCFNAGDYGEVQVKLLSGQWRSLPPRFVNSSVVWSNSYYDLTAYRDSIRQIGFYFHSVDVVGNGGPDVCSGWYIDSVAFSFTTAVSELNGIEPSTFYLSQNYPNPFNPSTKINFSIPTTSFAMLKVFDILGKEVATLVNEELKPGSYETTFDGKDLSSGVYFYRLRARQTDGGQAGSFVQTKKLVLLR